MVVHALGSDIDDYLHGDEPFTIGTTVEKYLSYIIIAAAIATAVIVMAGTGGRRT